MKLPHIRFIAKTAFLLFVVCFGGALSFYWINTPTNPAAITGAHPLNNHGHITYLNQRQWIAYVSLHTLALIFGVVFGIAVISLKKHSRPDERTS